MDSRSTIGSVFNDKADKFSLTASQFDGCVKLKKCTIETNAALNVALSIESRRMKLVAILEGTDNVNVVAEVIEEAASVDAPVQTTLTVGKYQFVIVAELAQKAKCTFQY